MLKICPGLNATEVQIPYNMYHLSVLIGKKYPKHNKVCQTCSNMKMSDYPAKYEVLMKQYLRSILDISDMLNTWCSVAVASSSRHTPPLCPSRLCWGCLAPSPTRWCRLCCSRGPASGGNSATSTSHRCSTSCWKLICVLLITHINLLIHKSDCKMSFLLIVSRHK